MRFSDNSVVPDFWTTLCISTGLPRIILERYIHTLGAWTTNWG